MRDKWNDEREEEDDYEETSFHSNSSSHLNERGGAGGRKERHYCELDENGEMVCRQLTSYECKLEDDVEQLQDALFRITSHYAKIQFRLRQIATASGCERMCLLKELERMTSQDLDNAKQMEIDSELPSLASDSQSLGNVRVKQHKILTQLRGRLQNLADAAGACFQTETGGCYNLSRCVCQSKVKQGVKLPIFDDDGNLIESHDQGCHCCRCQARLDQQGKGLPEGAIESEAPAPVLSPGRRYLSETWSDTDYGIVDMDEMKSKSMKKKKSKAAKKKSSSRSRKQSVQRHYDYEDLGSAGDQKTRKYSSEDNADDRYAQLNRRSRPKSQSKQRQNRVRSTNTRRPERMPPNSGSRLSSRATSRTPSPPKIWNASSPKRLSGQASLMGSNHSGLRQTPLLPNYSKSEPLRRSTPNQRPSGETRVRCPAVCRTNRLCQKPKENEQIADSSGQGQPRRRRPHYSSESDADTDRTENMRHTPYVRRSENEKKLGGGQMVQERSQKHLFNQIIGDNPRHQAMAKANNNNSTNQGNTAETNKSPHSSHGIACTCCSCSRRMAQDFGISPDRPSTSTSSNRAANNSPNQNKPLIVVKSSVWDDLKETQKDK
ncbi:serine/arginine repetitive matrix protein 1 [Drosophila tropicalis]|uniref:serine/arginine repetitive matrix protein 1 n=1 Tax=Drosophila tropicalis TaxID=46794 RepID=UPI0035AC1EC3